MSHSDDEDDFQSADEEGFGADETLTISKANAIVVTRDNLQDPLQNAEQIDGETMEIGVGKVVQTSKFSDEAKAVIDPIVTGGSKGYVVAAAKSTHLNKSKSECKDDKTIQGQEMRENDLDKEKEEEDDDEEEAMAERIRERNLKLARKFSAELAKNIKASAPIPVQSSAPIGFKVSSPIDYPNIIPDSETKSSPPAPPPTPALSSSFNNAYEPLSPIPTSGGSGTTQYGWRVPNKATGKPTMAETTAPDPRAEQTRQTLDRLAENLAQSDSGKNLFEKVAEDLKKVSIKPNEPIGGEGAGGIPLISDLGSTLGGWNWNSASRFLASASQVTSQVSSVLDSVVNASQHTNQPHSQNSAGHQNPRTSDEKDSARSQQQTSAPQDGLASTSTSSNQIGNDSKRKMSASEAGSNDALVDFTLSAMESLGKKAFGVMTERDESGSLQIKGLGRPWEHLLNITKGLQQQSDKLQPNSRDDESLPPGKHESKSQDVGVGSETSCDYKRGDHVDRSESSGGHMKNRRRRVNYEDDDKLD